jgi:hypothetical protein
MKNQFEPAKFQQFTIINEQHETIGHVRLKPSGVLWAPKNAKKWFGVDLHAFAGYMEKEGKQQAK